MPRVSGVNSICLGGPIELVDEWGSWQLGPASLSRPTEAEAGLQEDRLKPELQTPFGSDGVMPAIRFGVPTYGCALFK